MDTLLRSLSPPPGPWSGTEVVVNMVAAFLLGLFIVGVHRGTHRQMSVSFSFQSTLILICVIMAMVIMVIGDNIARAFGLAGAMSIIRFRTVVKDTRDTAFVFYAIAAGMAAGTGNLKLACIGTPLIGLFLAILHWTGHGTSRRDVYLLTLDTELGGPVDDAPHVETFRRHLEAWTLANARSVRAGSGFSHTFQVRLREGARPQEIVRDLSRIDGVLRVQLSLGEEMEA